MLGFHARWLDSLRGESRRCPPQEVRVESARNAYPAASHIRFGSSFLGGRRHRTAALFEAAALPTATRRPSVAWLWLLAGSWFVSGCDADLSPCARNETAADGTPRVVLWVDCKDEQAAQLVAVRVTPQDPLVDAGVDAQSDAGDAGTTAGDGTRYAWRIQSPIEDGTDYFYVEYAVAPRGWDTLVGPQALISGQRYEVEFVGTDIGSLSFDFKAP